MTVIAAAMVCGLDALELTNAYCLPVFEVATVGAHVKEIEPPSSTHCIGLNWP